MRPNDNQFLDTAAAIGSRICRDALWANGRCTWIGANMEASGATWTVAQSTLGPDLYAGTAGVALFLARLFRLTGEAPYRSAACGALRHASAHLNNIAPSLRPSFYSGALGVAYAAIAAGEIFASQEWIDLGVRIVGSAIAPSDTVPDLDVVTGIAGAIPALLSIDRRHNVAGALDAATRWGDELLLRATQTDIGTSWGMPNMPHMRHLTGFSHGAGGIAWALLELYAVTDEPRFREAAQNAFRYERHWFNPAVGNWPDFRDFGSPPTLPPAGSPTMPTCGMAWCHGAPGIGLSRLRAFQLLQDPILAQEADTAIRTTTFMLEQPVPSGMGSYSLCHGTAGNAELLLYAHTVLDADDYERVAAQIGRDGIAQYEQEGRPWPSGVTGGGETPNLLLGAAGTGYFYLRLADPELVPSVLLIIPEVDAVAAER
jgi:lantibiotic modifying enzyme